MFFHMLGSHSKPTMKQKNTIQILLEKMVLLSEENALKGTNHIPWEFINGNLFVIERMFLILEKLLNLNVKETRNLRVANVRLK